MAPLLIALPIVIASGLLSEMLARKAYPMARILGPLLVLGIVSACGLEIQTPPPLKLLCSYVLGVYFGLSFTRETMRRIRSMLAPALLVIAWYVAITLGYGVLLANWTFLDQSTSFLAVLPGGIAEANILAMDYQADMSVVTAFQMLRFVSIVLVIPLLVGFLPAGVRRRDGSEGARAAGTAVSQKTSRAWWLFFLMALPGSLVLTLIRFPAGALIGAMFTVTLGNLVLPVRIAAPPRGFYNAGQIVMGAIIGTSFTLASLRNIAALVLPILAITLLIFATSGMLAWILSRLFRRTYLSALLAVIPGGLSAMVILAGEMRQNVPLVATIQTLRLLTAVLLIPVVYSLVL